MFSGRDSTLSYVRFQVEVQRSQLAESKCRMLLINWASPANRKTKTITAMLKSATPLNQKRLKTCSSKPKISKTNTNNRLHRFALPFLIFTFANFS